MASGGRRVVSGSFVSDGLSRDVTVVGFRPTKVELYNDQGDSAVWTEEMADAAMHLRIAGGTGTFETSDGVTPLANGFTIGANGDINADTQTTYWTCSD